MEADHESPARGPQQSRDRKGAVPRSGQASIEFALLYSAVILPLTFMVVFVSEMLWVWHSVVDFTRDGATYAATHCWMGDGGNVTTYMTDACAAHDRHGQIPKRRSGAANQLFFAGPGHRAAHAVRLRLGRRVQRRLRSGRRYGSVTSYQFTKGLSTFFKLPPVTIPPFAASMPMQSAGCDESGNCLP